MDLTKFETVYYTVATICSIVRLFVKHNYYPTTLLPFSYLLASHLFIQLRLSTPTLGFKRDLSKFYISRLVKVPSERLNY